MTLVERMRNEEILRKPECLVGRYGIDPRVNEARIYERTAKTRCPHYIPIDNFIDLTTGNACSNCGGELDCDLGIKPVYVKLGNIKELPGYSLFMVKHIGRKVGSRIGRITSPRLLSDYKL
jgi:hypothetical protein